MREITVDLFAGGGGASAGIEQTLGLPVDVAINHDPVAIAIHKINHPKTEHWTQDAWKVPPKHATKGRPVGLLWASPDCTHHSKAKGGPPKRDLKRRDMAWIIEQWARDVKPRVIIMENVEEFRYWGPLDSKGNIIQSQKGATFKAFVTRLRRLGYSVQYKELRACDYGAPTSRKRLFLIARCDKQPIRWPKPTHGPGTSKPYRTAAECIDFTLPCPSIFDTTQDIKRKHGVLARRPLAKKTLQRIANGVQRFVLNSPDPFILSIDHQGAQSSNHTHSVQKLLGTISSKNRHAVVYPRLESAFLAKHFGGVTGQRIDKPSGAVTTKDHHSLVTSHLLHLRNNCDAKDTNSPLPTITAGGGHAGEIRAFLTKYYGCGDGQQLDEPAHTIVSRDRMGLVTVNIQGEPYIITDIGMRMLTPRELFRAQGFSDDYIIDQKPDGNRVTKSEQVRLCGNSVPPHFAKCLTQENCTLQEYENQPERNSLLSLLETGA